MIEWLEDHYEWVFILAVLWLTVTIYRTVMNIYNKGKKKKARYLGNFTGDYAGHGNHADFGGGSGGGAGSTRGFVPVGPVSQVAANDLNNVAGMTIASSNATDIGSVEGLTDIAADTSSQTLVEVVSDISPDADAILGAVETTMETAVEGVAESAVEVAAEIVDELLKG